MLSIRTFDTNNMLKDTFAGVSKMAIWGIPGYILAFALNYAFNDLLFWNVYVSYFLVSVTVTTLNFFIIDLFVFEGEKDKSLLTRVLGYLSVVYISKIGEWLIYSIIIWTTSIYYLLVQFIVTFAFILFKFQLLKKVLK